MSGGSNIKHLVGGAIALISLVAGLITVQKDGPQFFTDNWESGHNLLSCIRSDAGYMTCLRGEEHPLDESFLTAAAESPNATQTPVSSNATTTQVAIAPTAIVSVSEGSGISARRIPIGTSLPPGTLVVMSVVDGVSQTVDVAAQYLSQDTLFGSRGNASINGWQGYDSMASAQLAACQLAQSMQSDSRISGSWNANYTVTLAGGTVPGNC